MKQIKVFLIMVVVFSSTATFGQVNPFAKYGYDVKVLTMTNGRFNEFFDMDTVVQIGDLLFNTNSMKIIGFAEKDSITPMPDASVISRWVSPDPLAEKYWSITPYSYVAGNPIINIDPFGMDIVVTVDEGDSERQEDLYEKYKTTVSNAFGGNVSVDIDENGKVTFEQTGKLKGYDKKAFKMLNNIATNSDATANLILMDSDSEGSENISVGNFETGQIDLDDMAAYGNNNEWMTTKGKLVHETTEQFEKDKLAQQGDNVSLRDNSGKISQAFWSSHGTATDAENKCNKFQRGVYFNSGTKNGRAYNWIEVKNADGQVIRVRYEDVGPVINNN